MDQTQVTLTGKFTFILFRNEENFYTAAKFTLNETKSRVISVTGIIPEIVVGEDYQLKGTYVEHPRYGVQFKIDTVIKMLPSQKDGIIKYLSGPLYPGIGKKTATRIVEQLGDECLNKIKKDDKVLDEILDLSDEQKNTILKGLQEDNGLEDLANFLNIHGLGQQNLAKIVRTYGSESLRKLQENPYRLVEEIDGFGFITADKIGKSLGIDDNDHRRLLALLITLVADLCMKSGDSYIDILTLENAFCKGLRITGENSDFDEILEQSILNQKLVREENRVYPIAQYEAEVGISSFLADFPYKYLDPYDSDSLMEYLQSLQKQLGITYDQTQIHAIKEFFEKSFMIITGGPGTGKTTIVYAMMKLFKLMYPSSTVICAAPTGRAAKRLAELSGETAFTIHSLLQWNLESNTFGKNEDEPIYADLLIVDEFSMVDNWLFYHLLLASKHIKKICVIGDQDQLPSVGPGSVLRDLIDTNEFSCIELKHIYRQQNDSDVINLAHAIHEGTVNIADYQHDAKFYACPPQDIRKHILMMVEDALSKGYDIDDIQILSPMYAGAAGIDTLNNVLQEAFNPADKNKKEVRSGYSTMREGDKILQLKNQPDDDVYNGDIGRIIEIIDASQAEDHKTTIICAFGDIIVEYKPENWINITHAYCISVHKSQGSEYPIVIMPVMQRHAGMLQRKLIYTAITRARKALIVLGELDAFLKGVQVLDKHPRNTTLTTRIQTIMNDDSRF